jgi:peptidoglycan hydrolase-like protein with peptidoglycan-binding domain
VRDPVRNHRNSLAARQEPNFDDLFKAPRRKRKLARAGFWARFSARFSARGAVDLLAVFVAVAAMLLVFVNALGLQKASNAARITPQISHKSAAPISSPTVAPLPQPRPDPGNGRNRTDLLRDVQQELASRGYYDGAVDGAAGPRISQAIRDFELTQRLRVTGEASEILLGQIRKAGNKSDITGSIKPSSPAAGNAKILSAQRLLARYGYGPIRMNGATDKETHDAIERFERDRNLPPTGEVSERLMRELAAYSGGTLD